MDESPPEPVASTEDESGPLRRRLRALGYLD